MVTDIAVVGREQELARLRAFASAVHDGPCALVIEGEAGIGKSTLWEAGFAEAASRSMRVLIARPRQPEAGLSYSALGDLFEGVEPDALAGLPPPQRRALRVALLLEEPRGPPPEQRAVAVAVLAVLRAVAATAPVVVAIDDAHWVDLSSASVLAFAWSRVRGEPIGLLLSSRRDDGAGLSIEAVTHAPPTERMTLGPLSAGAIQRILRTRLGVGFPRPTLLRLHETCGGNPFYAIEIGRLLASAGSIAAGGPLPIPATFADVARLRLAALPKTVQDMLLAAAAMPDPTIAALEALAGSSRGIPDRVRRARAAGVIAVEGGHLCFTHPLLAAGVYASADAATLRRLHQQLAAVAEDVEARARHLALAAAGPDAEAAAALDEASDRAAARGALASAAELSELAARLTPDAAPRELLRRSLRAADLYLASGAAARARATLEPFRESLPVGPQRADVLERLARTSLTLDAHVELCEEALPSAAGDDRRSSRIYALLASGWPLRGGSRYALLNGRRALEHAQRSGDRRLCAVASARLALFEIWAGELTPGLLDRAVALERSRDRLSFSESPRMPLALLRLYQGRLEEGRAALEAGLRAAAARGDDLSCVEIRGRLVELEIRSGRWARAAGHADAASELSEQIGLEQVGRAALFRRSLIDAHRGDAAAARAAAEAGAALSDDAHLATYRLMNLGVIGFLELSQGNAAAADIYLRPTLDWLVELRLALAPFPVAAYALEALIESGQVDDARPLVAQLEREGRALDSPWTSAVAARLRASIEAADGRPAAAMQSLTWARATEESYGWPFERARILLGLGEVQRRAKQKRAARDSLAAARAQFETLGAPLWAQRAAGGLARISGRTVSGNELTASERRVAELVASGRTNREVAAALFLATRTVEWNLSKIYAKLGVRSRSELTRRITLRPQPPAQ